MILATLSAPLSPLKIGHYLDHKKNKLAKDKAKSY